MNITPQQQQWIVDHMGHTLNVHNIHYRCTVDVIERIDISKLLLMMDHGQIARFKGKTLDDIKIEGNIFELCWLFSSCSDFGDFLATVVEYEFLICLYC